MDLKERILPKVVEKSSIIYKIYLKHNWYLDCVKIKIRVWSFYESPVEGGESAERTILFKYLENRS